MSRKVFIKTFGCQMNEYDSDKLADVLQDRKSTRLNSSHMSESRMPSSA